MPENVGSPTEHLPNSKIIRTSPEAQGFSQWSSPVGTLGELIQAATIRAQALAARTGELERLAAEPRAVPSFASALAGPSIAVIAEIKRASPSRGDINKGISAARQARAYEAGGAAAVSVLTEPHRFGGRDSDLTDAARACELPMLKKDFHVSEIQLIEAKAMGSSAALIIVRALSPARLRAMAAVARDIDLEILFEIRDEAELDRALEAGALTIGVNNRDLETLEVDPTTVPRIVPLIPRDRIAIAESGYSTIADVQTAARAGADAVLVGSVLSASADPGATVRAMSAVARFTSVR